MDLQETVNTIMAQLADFAGYIEIEKFEDFFFFSMGSEGGPEGVASMLGMGGSKEMVLNYDPILGIYYSRVMSGPQDSNSITVFTRDNPIADQWEDLSKKFHIPTKDKSLETVFPQKIRDVLSSQKASILFVQSSDVSALNDSQRAQPTIKIETIYHTLLSLVAGYNQVKSVFVLEGADGAPDVLFNFNFSMFPVPEQQNNIQIEAYVDPDHLTAGKKFISVDTESYEVQFLDEIDDIRHNMQYTLVLHIKSFNKP
jgi:hypothetical protein